MLATETTFALMPSGPFSWDAACDVVAHFSPLSRHWAGSGDPLRIAFSLDGSFEPVAVALRWDDEMYEVHMRHVPEQQILTIERHVRQPQLVDFLMEWMPGVAAALDKTGVKHATHSFVVYHGEVSEDSDGPVEVCMAFEGAIEASEGMQVRIEPAHEEAYATISKEQCEFPRILEAYDAVQGFVKEQGMETTASPREVYFVDINAVGPGDPFVDIAWPAAPAPELAASQPIWRSAQ